MKTVKEVSEFTGVSIRTLRYYDEIGLLKPVQLTEAGYRLYDNKSLEKLQHIMFFRELEIPLTSIKEIMDNPNYNKEQALLTQKSLLENKRNRLNGIIELITDVMKGVNTMSFEGFSDNDVTRITDHILNNMPKETFTKKVEEYGSVEMYRGKLATNLKSEKVTANILKYYGCKEKAVEAMLQPVPDKEKIAQRQKEFEEIYKQLIHAKNTKDAVLEKEAVANLAEQYKKLGHLVNARAILLDLAKEYMEHKKFSEGTDNQHGKGAAEYFAQAIQRYYGEL